MYKYILQDFDGTIAKTLDLWLNMYKDLLKARKIEIPSDKQIVNKAFGKWGPGLAALGIKDSEEAYDEAKSKVYENYTKVDLYDGAREILEYFKSKNKKVALLSSSAKDRVVNAVNSKGLSKYFDLILTKDDVTNGKPDPEIFLKALKILNGNKEEAVVIGDSYHDIQGGKNAGVATVAFYPKENEKFYTRGEIEKEKPDFIATDLNSIIKLVS